jgi:hypothetical protein
MKMLTPALCTAALILTACGGGGDGGEDASLKSACMKMEADAEATEYVSDAGVEFEAFCDCLSAQILALPEADKAEASAALMAVTDKIDGDDADTEAIVRDIRNKGEADGATEEAVVLAASVDELGDFIGGTVRALEDGGACPA